MTAKQRYSWDAVVIALVFCPIFALVFSPYRWGLIGCLVSSPLLLVGGFILVVRHKTFLGLVPIIFALCFLFLLWAIPASYH
jgi:hypothetical protein